MLSISLKTAQFERQLTNIIDNTLPVAVANALNRTTEDVQARLQQEIHAKFAVRTSSSAQFLERMVKFDRGDRATPARLATRIAIVGPENAPGRAEMLTRHIEGGSHTMPGSALSSFYIPADGTRPSRMSVVPRNLYPSNLGLADRKDVTGIRFARRHVTRSGAIQLKGKQRTFVLVSKDGRTYGVYQREGPHDIQLLWFYTPRITVPARYDFFGIARRTFAERFPINVRGMLGSASTYASAAKTRF